VLSAEERLQELEKVFDGLEEDSEKVPIIVEGVQDVAALKRLGIHKNVMAVNRGISIFAFAEMVSKRYREAIVLTDWDRRGGQLARMLKEALMANGVSVNNRHRAQIVILSKKEIKDIQSLPRFVERLRAARRPQIGARR